MDVDDLELTFTGRHVGVVALNLDASGTGNPEAGPGRPHQAQRVVIPFGKREPSQRGIDGYGSGRDVDVWPAGGVGQILSHRLQGFGIALIGRVIPGRDIEVVVPDGHAIERAVKLRHFLKLNRRPVLPGQLEVFIHASEVVGESPVQRARVAPVSDSIVIGIHLMGVVDGWTVILTVQDAVTVGITALGVGWVGRGKDSGQQNDPDERTRSCNRNNRRATLPFHFSLSSHHDAFAVRYLRQ